MNRRSFLTGLLAMPVAAELGRVYSFPTNIVIVDQAAILKMWFTASGWKSHQDIIKPLPQSYVRCCGPRFREMGLSLILATEAIGAISGARQ